MGELFFVILQKFYKIISKQKAIKANLFTKINKKTYEFATFFKKLLDI